MHQEDARHVRNYAERHARAEALAAHPHPQGDASEGQVGDGACDGTAADDGWVSGAEAEAGGQAAEAAPLLNASHSKHGSGGEGQVEGDGRGNCAVLPWWLPPERIPPAVSGERGAAGGGGSCSSVEQCLHSRARQLSADVWALLGMQAQGCPLHNPFY
jgi:hypothetical protein